MSRSKDNPSTVFVICLVIFCLINWLAWQHFNTWRGPQAIATVVEKYETVHKGTRHYHLRFQFRIIGKQTVTSNLEVGKHSYSLFAVQDNIPINYSKNSPEQTMLVASPLFYPLALILYSFLVLILVTSFLSLRKENKVRKRRYNARRNPKRNTGQAVVEPYCPLVSQAVAAVPNPRVYSVTKTLAWALIGVGMFSGGVLSCRHSSNAASQKTELVAPQFAQATVLSVQYYPGSVAPTALVRVPSLPEQTVSVPLTAKQHALFYAQLNRSQSEQVQALVAYSPDAPELTVLVDEDHPGKEIQQVSSHPTIAGIDSDILGWVLIIIGTIIVYANLEKYVRHYNTWN